MPTFMQRGSTWLAGKLESPVSGRNAMYSHGVFSVPGTATVTTKDYEITNSDGVNTVITSYDVLWRRSTLIIDGQLVVPRVGDRIVAQFGGITMTFEAMPLDQKPCFEDWNIDKEMFLIHTKKVG